MKYGYHVRNKNQRQSAADLGSVTGHFGIDKIWRALGASCRATPSGFDFVNNVYTHGPYYIWDTPGLTIASAGYIGGYKFAQASADANSNNIDLLTVHTVTSIGVASGVYNCRMGLFCRGSGSFGSETCYFATFDVVNNVFEIYKRIAGVDTQLATVSMGTLLPDYDYYIRFRANGTSLKLTVWRWDMVEPSTPTLAVTDASISSAGSGWCGLCWHTSTTTQGIYHFANISAGTNGDVAPMMVSHRQFALWATKDQAKVFLAQAQVYGVNASNSLQSDGVCAMATPPGYITGTTDDPPSMPFDDVILEVPRWTFQSGEGFIGSTRLSIGDLVVANEGGVRDHWLTCSWDGQTVSMLLGGVAWAFWDFFVVGTATVIDIYTPAPGKIGFKLSDMSSSANKLLQTNVANGGIGGLVGGTGQNANLPAPIVMGRAFNISPTYYGLDPVTTQPVYLYTDWTGTTTSATVDDVRNNGESLIHFAAITAVDTVNDLLTSAAHGLMAGSVLQIVVGPAPGGLFVGLIYYVIAAGLTPNDFKVSTSPGGSPVNITTNTTGGIFGGQQWVHERLSGAGTFWCIKLNSDPGGGQITADINNSVVGAGPGGASGYFSNVVLRLGLNSESDLSFGVSAIPSTIISVFYNAEENGVDALDEIMKSVGCLWGFNRLGNAYGAPFQLPPSAYMYDLSEDDVDFDTFALQGLILPSFASQLGFQRNYTVQTTGLAQLGITATQAAQYMSEAQYTNIAEIVISGNDKPANHKLALRPKPRVTGIYLSADAVAEATRISTMLSKIIGVFRMSPRIYQPFYEVGQGLRLTHSRYGFDLGKSGQIVSVDETPNKADSTLTVAFQLDGVFPSVPGTSNITPKYLPYTEFYKS